MRTEMLRRIPFLRYCIIGIPFLRYWIIGISGAGYDIGLYVYACTL